MHFWRVFALSLLVGVSMPLAAAQQVEVQGHLSGVAGGEQMSERISVLWDFISKTLGVPASTAPPLIYIYPIDPKLQPALLTDLQIKMKGDFGPDVSEADLFRALAALKGITYRSDLFPETSVEKGRVIQINAAKTFYKETGGSYGYGLYITAHEMVHYALSQIGIDIKYHHCLMAHENQNNESLMLKILKHQIQQNWASEVLSFRGMSGQGYVEEAMSCGGDLAEIQKTEGKEAVDRALHEAARLAEPLL